MSAKPTPTQYMVKPMRNTLSGSFRRPSGAVVVAADSGDEIALFRLAPSYDVAVSNARAWVDGKSALERLDRIRAIMRQQNVKRSVMWNQLAEEIDDDEADAGTVQSTPNPWK